MGWGRRVLALFVMTVAFGLGAWPGSLLALVYFVYSFRKPKAQGAIFHKQQVLPKPRRPLGRYILGGSLLLLSVVALGAGGTFSPLVFLLGGVAVLLSPFLPLNGLASQVVPVKESILLRRRLLPIMWYVLAEVKLEAQDQTRGVASMDGQLLVFAGKNPSAIQVLSVFAFGHKEAEDKVVRMLRRETRMLSQRGAHLLPLDSGDAYRRLSLKLGRLKIGADEFEATSSLPFDVFTIEAKEGLIVRHGTFRIEEPEGSPSIPPADLSNERQPLLAEVVEEITKRHGWPPPDEFSPFLAALDASRTEPLCDRLRINNETDGRVAAETPGGAEVRLTKAQLRTVARIYG